MLDDIKPEAEVDENVLMLIKQLKETSEELDNLTEEENEDNDTQRNDTQKKIDLIKAAVVQAVKERIGGMVPLQKNVVQEDSALKRKATSPRGPIKKFSRNASTLSRSEEGSVEGDGGREGDVAPKIEWPGEMEFAHLKESHTDFTMKGRITHVSPVHKNDAMKDKFVGGWKNFAMILII